MDDRARDEPPPVLGRWSNWYVLVLGTLVALILVFASLTLVYR